METKTFISLIPCAINWEQTGIFVLLKNENNIILEEITVPLDIIDKASDIACNLFMIDKNWLKVSSLTPRFIDGNLILPFRVTVPIDSGVSVKDEYAWCISNSPDIQESKYSTCIYDAVRLTP